MDETMTTLRPLHGHAPAGDATAWRPGMFERDDLYLRERLAELRAAAHHPYADAHGESLLERARRSLGRSLIAMGTAVAGTASDAREVLAADEACTDCGVGAAA